MQIPTRQLKMQFHNPNPIHDTFIQAEVHVVNNTIIIGAMTNILTWPYISLEKIIPISLQYLHFVSFGIIFGSCGVGWNDMTR
jgi:hypothetical protein